MNKNLKNKQMLQRDDTEEWLEEYEMVASATECTGLMPTPPVSNQEAEAYTEIYGIPQPVKERKTEKKYRTIRDE